MLNIFEDKNMIEEEISTYRKSFAFRKKFLNQEINLNEYFKYYISRNSLRLVMYRETLISTWQFMSDIGGAAGLVLGQIAKCNH